MQVYRLTNAVTPILPVPHLVAGKKYVLSDQEQYFIAVTRAILDGAVTPTMEAIFGRMEGALRELAWELCVAYQEYGQEAFWKSYDTCAEDIPRLQQLRALVADEAGEKNGVLLSEGEDRVIEWLWEPYLALGEITVLAGGPGVGKSAVAIDLAARVTTGSTFPDGERAPWGGVVLIAPEDGLWDTLRPRFARVGADLSKIVSVSRIPAIDPTSGYAYERAFSLPGDIALLDRAMQRVQAKLLIIDAVPSLLNVCDQDLRVRLAPVQALLHKYQAACILIHRVQGRAVEGHTFAQQDCIEAFTRIACSTLIVEPDTRAPGHHVLRQLRTVLGEYTQNLPFRIVNDRCTTGDPHPYVLWVFPSHEGEDFYAQAALCAEQVGELLQDDERAPDLPDPL